LFNDLEENLKFHIVNNIFVDVDVDVDAKELNDVLSFRRHSQVDEDNDNDEINV
jgi:hypothetical protein